MATNWRDGAGTLFDLRKHSASASKGMVVANHPLGAVAGAEMLAMGGNAVDAAVATLFTQGVVEPMMVSMFGGGWMNLRLGDGPHVIVDDYPIAPAAARPDLYRPVSDTWPDYMQTEGRENMVGPLAVAVPGCLKGWCEVLEKFGNLSLSDVIQPAIRHAANGFPISPYLAECISEAAADIRRFPETARVLLPGGDLPEAGNRLVQDDLAETLRTIASEGPDALYRGAIGAQIVDAIQQGGGILTQADLEGYRTVWREPLRGEYRGYEIVGPPPPTAGGVHVIEMLNILEGYDVAGIGFGTADHVHLLAEVFKIAFADRNASMGDPAFVDVPVDTLISKAYAEQRRAEIDMTRAGAPGAGMPSVESAHTTHVTAADAEGNVVAMTQSLNNTFGSKVIAPGTGVLLNNYMAIFDPHPGTANSVVPGKRSTSSNAPTIVQKDGAPVLALGLPGGVRIFTSVLQALVNAIDFGMTPQEMVEAPRVWTQGQELQMEWGFPEAICEAVAARGHDVSSVRNVAGGMNAVAFESDGMLTGAACWRADGTPVGVSGGYADRGVRFRPEA
ncbi:MAG: gamma-glutamyltransferase [bacterium]|nr:gamma-glutamyltransferase [bacterium]